MRSGNNNSKVPEEPDHVLYTVPIKGYIGNKKKTIFYVIVNSMGDIVRYSCQHVNEMLEVSHDDVIIQIERYLSKKIIK